MTLLLEGKESRAHAMMDEFQFTGDTPHSITPRRLGNFNITIQRRPRIGTASANKIYSSALKQRFC